MAAVRREAVALYRQAKGGVVEAQLAGRLGHLLQLLVTISRDQEFEARLAALEKSLPAPRRNGGGSYYAARP